jgi:hypothetical protein
MHEASGGQTALGRFRGRLVGLGVAALVAFAISGAAARDAEAQEPFSFELNHGVIDIGFIGGLDFLTPGTPATFDGTIDEAGAFTVPAENIFLPPTSQTFPYPGVGNLILEISMTPNGPLTGTFDVATGELDSDVSIRTTVDVSLPDPPNPPIPLGSCDITPIPLGFSTSGTNPYQGVPFTEGIDGPGAVVASWDDLPTPVPPGGGTSFVCDTMEGFVDGPGGVWLSHDIEDPPIPPLPPELTITVRPGREKVKPGRSARFEVRSRNVGELVAEGVELCARVPKALRVNGKRGQVCKRAGDLEPGPASTATFTVRTTRQSAGKTYNLRFTARGNGVRPSTGVATLKVEKKKRPRR